MGGTLIRFTVGLAVLLAALGLVLIAKAVGGTGAALFVALLPILLVFAWAIGDLVKDSLS